MRQRLDIDNKKQNVPFFILSIVLILILIGVIIFAINKSNQESAGNTQGTDLDTDTESEYPEKWQEGVISYKGKYYQFNNDINTYLFLGIDKDEQSSQIEGVAKGGQSDAMFLLVTNADDETLSVISINRNAMTQVELFGETGASLGTTTAQICTQHSFGDGLHLSCSRTVEAVKYLFYNLPIDGYLSMTMGAMPVLNDAVGGVTVTVLEDIVNEGAGVNLKEGETVTLQGMEAYYYLRARDQEEFDSATNRLRRQEQYIAGLMAELKAVAQSGTSKALELYQSIEEHIVTNVDFVSFISELKSYEYEESRLYTVPGETVMGEKFEEYHVDDTALYDLIIQVFYEEVSAK